MPVLRLQLIFAFGVEELMGAVVIGFGHENVRRAVQVASIRQAGIHEFLGADDAVFLEHDDEHFGVHDGAGVEKLHADILTTDEHGWTRIKTTLLGARHSARAVAQWRNAELNHAGSRIAARWFAGGDVAGATSLPTQITVPAPA